MTQKIFKKGVINLETVKVSGTNFQIRSDAVSIEEPLEIRLGFPNDLTDQFRQIAVTMRTPGADRELAAGFLFTEGIVKSADDLQEIIVEKCNVVTVRLKDHVLVDPAIYARHSFVASSCGVCGKKTIAAVRVKKQFSCHHDTPLLSPEIIHRLPQALREAQSDFDYTGGIHASCLFDSEGRVLVIKEDVGRHNALDKVLGTEFLNERIPLWDKVLMVSGRASFELVQKAAHAGLAVLAAVGAPSSLAVQLAEECDMTLLGFVRDGRFNIYSGKHRIAGFS